eukprot:164612-Chlamydomonas_euryale.AAC.2
MAGDFASPRKSNWLQQRSATRLTTPRTLCNTGCESVWKCGRGRRTQPPCVGVPACDKVTPNGHATRATCTCIPCLRATRDSTVAAATCTLLMGIWACRAQARMNPPPAHTKCVALAAHT